MDKVTFDIISFGSGVVVVVVNAESVKKLNPYYGVEFASVDAAMAAAKSAGLVVTNFYGTPVA